jgi:hypothetical protein
MDEISLIKSEKGQSVVEYILLLLVIVVLSNAVFKSDLFLDFVGPDSDFFQRLKVQTEYAYRHGVNHQIDDDSDYEGGHHTYINPQSGLTRFFTNIDAYP